MREAELKCWNRLGTGTLSGTPGAGWWQWDTEVTGRNAAAGRGCLMALMAQVFRVFGIWGGV